MLLQYKQYAFREYHENDCYEVEALLPRLNNKGYSVPADDCTHVVLLDQAIVGAFHVNFSNYLSDRVFRLCWLVAKERCRGVGTYIVKEACKFAIVEQFSALHTSYNINNTESVNLFERKHEFIRLGLPSEGGETESMMNLT